MIPEPYNFDPSILPHTLLEWAQSLDWTYMAPFELDMNNPALEVWPDINQILRK